jgi:PPOX class probable F420-dependent enzyme
MPKMTAAEVEAFLAEPRIAKLATLRADGSPTIVPVWFEWDGATATVFTERASPKVKRIRADPRVALSVEEPVGVPERWVTLEGTASIEEAGGIELARRLAPRYYTPGRAREALAQWERVADSWVLLRIIPSRIRSG